MILSTALLAVLLATASEPLTATPSGDETTAEARDAAKGPINKPLLVPGTQATFKFGGFAQVDFIQDFDPIGNAYDFKTNTIPVDNAAAEAQGGRNTISAKGTRLNVDFRSGESAERFRVFVEGDFFGTGNYEFRLRHAYGEWKGLLGGQTWTTFMDVSIRPPTLDFEGSDAEINVRQPMIRYTGHPGKAFECAVAVEDSTSDVSSAGTVAGVGRSEYPDLPFYARHTRRRGHLQVAGIVRQLRFVSADGTVNATAAGYGIDLSGKVRLARPLEIMGSLAFGRGIAHYTQAFNGTGSDAVLTPGGAFNALDMTAAVLGFTLHWNPRLQSTLADAFAEVDNDPSQPATAIHAIRSTHLNLLYSPRPLVQLGGELMWGERENFDGNSNDAVRFQFSIKFMLG